MFAKVQKKRYEVLTSCSCSHTLPHKYREKYNKRKKGTQDVIFWKTEGAVHEPAEERKPEELKIPIRQAEDEQFRKRR